MSKKRVVAVIVLMLLGGLVYLGAQMRRHGFSAQTKPSWVEVWFARHVRRMAMPAEAKTLLNPYPVTPESVARGRDHFAAHCAVCHDFDGRGRTDIGRNLYPKVPDMSSRATQGLTDGELFYIIQNGVRFTGMPAWQSEHTVKETWELVAFLRRLPQLTPEEVAAMREKAAHEPEEHHHEDGEEAPGGHDRVPHSH